jgi:hypothetical protein
MRSMPNGPPPNCVNPMSGPAKGRVLVRRPTPTDAQLFQPAAGKPIGVTLRKLVGCILLVATCKCQLSVLWWTVGTRW